MTDERDTPDTTGTPDETDVQPIPHVRYPNWYVWLVFVSSMDIIMTRAVLAAGGREANPIAESVIQMWGLWGLIIFKFCLTAFVIFSCEIVGRRNDRVGLRLVRFGVVVSGFPMVWAFILLYTH